MNDHSDFQKELISKLNSKTKPIGSLGRVEEIAAKVAKIQNSLQPSAETCELLIFAGDHGMAAAGVSAYPQAVTRQMVLNFLDGGAAANVFARSVGAKVQVIDAGVAGDAIDHSNLVLRRIAEGTQNALEHPAMSREQLRNALEAGRTLGRAITADVACFGEMGIGNTSSASLVASKILEIPIEDLVGRGTGLDDDGLKRKSNLLQVAASRTDAHLDAKTALTEYGGFEIAMMAGSMMGAVETRRVVVVDGFISTVSALCAQTLKPECQECYVFAHKSAEAGHKLVLEGMDAKPLLDLGMRLGEGTGSLLAFPLIKASAIMLREMASFESANISGPV